jgi:DNA mismatch repair protein MutS2
MIFPPDFETRIGFIRLRDQLKGYCLSPLGTSAVDRMVFQSDISSLTPLLQCNAEFVRLIFSGTAYPDRDYWDPRESFGIAAIDGSCLNPEDFLNLRNALRTILLWGNFMKQHGTEYPQLAALAEPVQVPSAFVKILDQKIDDQARLRDNASPDLARIRKALTAAESGARRLTDQLFRQAVADGYTPEGAQPVYREGRVVIPIRAEHKRRVRGVIVDESATGQTIFIEPDALVEFNNEIRDLQHEERREVLRILRELTAQLRAHLPELIRSFDFLAAMDLNRAKARLSLDLNAALPALQNKPALNWQQARHPLLTLLFKGKRTVVAQDISLFDDSRVLLVSGPNAGGKSVCLKTVGLLQYMLQCGLLPPASGDSTFGIFKEILLDIGDQQSIENDLSTYSSHLRNMATFVEYAGASSMVLIDEMGAGTDPAFGGGIAEAVLVALVRKKSWGLVTTHYANLKTLSSRMGGIRNGAMLFDSERLTPLFLLQIGKPGSSYAMELARKSGLGQAVILEAESIIGTGLVGLEALMRKTETEKVQIEKLKTALQQKETQLQQQTSRYQKLSAELEEKKKEILSRAKASAADLLRDTNREIEKTIRHIRENKAEKKETLKVRQKLTQLKEQVELPAHQLQKKQVFKEGDRVQLVGQDQSGTVLSVKGDQVSVQFGLMRSTVRMAQLLPATAIQEKRTERIAGLDISARRSVFQPQIDLRGKRAEEVIPLLEAFMDDVILFSVPEVRILHGKGEGVLRQMVRDHLRRNKQVAAMRDEHADRGGAGITIVEMAR